MVNIYVSLKASTVDMDTLGHSLDMDTYIKLDVLNLIFGDGSFMELSLDNH